MYSSTRPADLSSDFRRPSTADGPGLAALAGQIVLDVGMLSFVYLPTFYTFKAAVFSG